MEREKFSSLLFICENKKRNGIKNIFYPFYRQVYDNIYSVFGTYARNVFQKNHNERKELLEQSRATS